MKLLLVLLAVLLSACSPKEVTYKELVLAVDSCRYNSGILTVRPETEELKGIVKCNNGATFYYEKGKVTK